MFITLAAAAKIFIFAHMYYISTCKYTCDHATHNGQRQCYTDAGQLETGLLRCRSTIKVRTKHLYTRQGTWEHNHFHNTPRTISESARDNLHDVRPRWPSPGRWQLAMTCSDQVLPHRRTQRRKAPKGWLAFRGGCARRTCRGCAILMWWWAICVYTEVERRNIEYILASNMNSY